MNKLTAMAQVYGASSTNEDGAARIFLVIFVMLAVLSVIFPEQAWWIEHGMPKDTEPSDAGILVTRIGGIFCAIIGGIFLILTFN